jgi:phenylacetate-CoA ligase
LPERLVLRVVIYVLGLFRWAAAHDARAYALFTLPALQPLLEAIGRLRAREVFLRARAECPAYREFLAANGAGGAPPRAWAEIPVTTKENYVRRWSIEARCFGGALRGRGEMIDESSGSSGLPNNWVRSAAEREDVKRLLQLNYDLMYGGRPRMLLNCFALGPWATGMNVSMSLADVGVLKSIGPDALKLENTLRTFGTRYEYLVFGYPPFVKATRSSA